MMSAKEKILLIIGFARLEIDIQKCQRAMDGTTDSVVRKYLADVIEGDRFTQNTIAKMLYEGEKDDISKDETDQEVL